MSRRIESILAVAGDMQSFDPQEDDLTRQVRECTEDELSEEDLTFVAAAGRPSYQDFLKKAMERRK